MNNRDHGTVSFLFSPVRLKNYGFLDVMFTGESPTATFPKKRFAADTFVDKLPHTHALRHFFKTCHSRFCCEMFFIQCSGDIQHGQKTLQGTKWQTTLVRSVFDIYCKNISMQQQYLQCRPETRNLFDRRFVACPAFCPTFCERIWHHFMHVILQNSSRPPTAKS